MSAMLAQRGKHTGLAAPAQGPRTLSYRPARRFASTHRLQASSEEDSAHSHTSLQGRFLGVGLGLALSLGVTAAPALADPVQDLQNVAGNTTVGQTAKSLFSGNPIESVQNQTKSAADSAAKAAPSPSGGNPLQGLGFAAPALPGGDGPSVGNSLKNAFTTSPPQISSKGSGGSSSSQGPDLTNYVVGGGAAAVLAATLAAGQQSDAPQKAAKGAKSSAKKASGSQPVQKAKGLLNSARSGSTQPLKKGSQKTRSGTGRVGSKASSAAKQAQQSVPGGKLPLAGLAAAGLVVAGVVLAVTLKPGGAPSLNDTPAQEVASSAGDAAQGAKQSADAVQQKGSEAAQAAGDVTDRVPPQTPQGSPFDLSLGDGSGPNNEPLNPAPSVDKVDAPKPGGIPVFGPPGTEQAETGSAAAPKDEQTGQESSVRPGGYKGGPQQDLSLEDLSTSVQEVKDNLKSGGPSLPNPFESKGNPGQEQRTDQLLEPQGVAAEAQRKADQASLSKSDEKRIDRDT